MASPFEPSWIIPDFLRNSGITVQKELKRIETKTSKANKRSGFYSAKTKLIVNKKTLVCKFDLLIEGN